MASDDPGYELPCTMCLLIGSGLTWPIAVAMGREYFDVPLEGSTMAALTTLLDAVSSF